MSLSLRRWRPRHLLLAWTAYWIGLILVTLWPALLAGWRLSRTDGHGNAGAGLADGVLTANIVDSGRTVWTGSVSLFSMVLLLCLPPLALWLVWLVTTSRAKNAEALPPGMNESFSQTSVRQKREEF